MTDVFRTNNECASYSDYVVTDPKNKIVHHVHLMHIYDSR